eukprot:gene25300-46292_t
MKNPFRSTRIFLGEMVGELQKATWPSRIELRDSTIVVVFAAVILGVFTAISDFSLTQVVILFTDWWFALHTLSGQENKVKHYVEKFKKAEELDDAIFEVLLPTEVVSEVKNGKKSTKVRKLYPGYVFIQMCLYGEDQKVINKPWYFVKEVAGVIGFVGGDRPAALRQSEIDEIRSRIEAANGKEVPKVQYLVGEEVKITDGAFASLTGRIDEIDPERGKLKVSVSIFGRFTPVELEYWQVQ